MAETLGSDFAGIFKVDRRDWSGPDFSQQQQKEKSLLTVSLGTTATAAALLTVL